MVLPSSETGVPYGILIHPITLIAKVCGDEHGDHQQYGEYTKSSFPNAPQYRFHRVQTPFFLKQHSALALVQISEYYFHSLKYDFYCEYQKPDHHKQRAKDHTADS